MRYKFTPSDETLPWAGALLPIVRPLDMRMDDLAEALRALGWRLTDLHALTRKSLLAHLEQRAQRAGEKYVGPPSEITGDDEIVLNQLITFATLRTGGFQISWQQACGMRLTDFTPVPDDAEDEALIAGIDDAEDADGEGGDEVDPQDPARDSAPDVAEGQSSPEQPGQQ